MSTLAARVTFSPELVGGLQQHLVQEQRHRHRRSSLRRHLRAPRLQLYISFPGKLTLGTPSYLTFASSPYETGRHDVHFFRRLVLRVWPDQLLPQYVWGPNRPSQFRDRNGYSHPQVARRRQRRRLGRRHGPEHRVVELRHRPPAPPGRWATSTATGPLTARTSTPCCRTTARFPARPPPCPNRVPWGYWPSAPLACWPMFGNGEPRLVRRVQDYAINPLRHAVGRPGLCQTSH